MIVGNLNLLGTRVFPYKAHAVLIIYSNTVLPDAVIF